MNLTRVKTRTNWKKENNGDLLADPYNILNRRKSYFCQLLNMLNIKGVRQTEMYTAEPSVPEPICFKVEISTEKLKRYKS
jgi:hypothetical protein